MRLNGGSAFCAPKQIAVSERACFIDDRPMKCTATADAFRRSGICIDMSCRTTNVATDAMLSAAGDHPSFHIPVVRLD
ncbi:MAG: hypothetical protein KIT73_13705 [Burkholderiales bacterium]|nr:hypothetical protein [Burkholderiales bacterium]